MNDLLGVRNFTGSAAGVKLPRSKRIDGRSHGNRVVGYGVASKRARTKPTRRASNSETSSELILKK
jgi:hypothetical protein